MLDHAKSEAPLECCGLLAGRNQTAERVYTMTNIEKSPVRYMIDPKEQFAAFKEMRADQIELLAIYHSHPHSAAYPSATDVRLAYYDEAVYLIVSLNPAGRPVVNGFRIVNQKITEEPFEVVDDANRT